MMTANPLIETEYAIAGSDKKLFLLNLDGNVLTPLTGGSHYKKIQTM